MLWLQSDEIIKSCTLSENNLEMLLAVRRFMQNFSDDFHFSNVVMPPAATAAQSVEALKPSAANMA